MANPYGHVKHGKRRTRAYQSWADMKTRVLNPACKDHHLYVGRTIDPRWMDFANFYADMGERPEGLTLERIDNNKGYGPDNCRWATRKEQANNKAHRNGTKTKLNIETVEKIRKESGPLRKIAAKYGVSQTCVFNVKHDISWQEVRNV